MAKSLRKKVNPPFLIALLLIIVLGSLLRVWGLSSYPVELYSQEALLGWRAKSLLFTGKDETGRQLPLIFSSLEGYQLPLSSYLPIPSIGIFGLTPLAVRLPFALMGVLAIPALFGVVNLLFPRNNKVALWSAFFLAINPWTVYLSRNCSAENLSLFFFLLGFFFWLLSSKKNSRFRWLAIFFLSLTLLAAKIAWFFLPPFLVFFWIFLFQKRRRMLVDIFLIALTFLPLFLAYFKAPLVKTDLLNHDLTLFSEPSIITGIDLMRGENIKFSNPFLGRVFYNKLFYLQKLAANFLRHLNPRFYFVNGDVNPHHGLTNFGPILAFFLPLALVGVWLMWRKERRILLFLTGWFFLATIPSFLVLPSPDQARAIFVLPILAIITAYTLSQLNKSYLVVFLILLSFNFAFVFQDGLFKEPLRFQEDRQVGYRKLAWYIDANFEKYRTIYLTDAYGADPGPALIFYFNYPVEKFQKTQDPKLVYRRWINRVEKILINQREIWEAKKEGLYIITPDEEKLHEEKGEFKEINIIENLTGEPIFLIFEYEEKI